MAVSSTTSTGINVPEIVTGLMDVERVPLTKLQTQVDEKTLVISTLGVFKSKVSALESAAKALTTPGIYALRDATSSDATKVSATASNSAAAATYAVKVAQTAQAASLSVSGFTSATQVVDLSEVAVTYAGTTYSPQFAKFAATGFAADEVLRFRLNGESADQSFTITTQTTATQVAESINAAVVAGTLSDVVASVSGGELLISSTNPLQGLSSASHKVPDQREFSSSLTFQAGDVIKFKVASGAEQTFTVTTETTAEQVKDAINAAVTATTLSGVQASVVSDKLTITTADGKVLSSATHTRGTTVTGSTAIQNTRFSVDATSQDGLTTSATVSNVNTWLNSLGADISSNLVQVGTNQYALSVNSTATGAANTLTITGLKDTGGGASAEIQKIDSLSPLVADGTYTLTLPGGAVLSATLDSDPTLGELVSGLTGDADYAASGVVLTEGAGADAGKLILTYQANGNVAAATLEVESPVSPTTYAASEDVEGVTEDLVADPAVSGVAEVQSVTPADPLTAGATYSLTLADGSTVLSAVVDSSPTLAELVAALTADADYAASPVTLSEGTGGDAGKIIITYKASGAVARLASLELQPLPTTTSAGTITSTDGSSGAGTAFTVTALQAARDAFVSINGLELQRSSNVIDDVVTGVTFSLNTPTVPAAGAISLMADADFSSGTTNATVNVTAGAQDLSSQAVQDFVTSYNDLISFYKTETVASTDPASRGVLNGDSNVRSFMDRLRTLYVQGIRLADGSNISFSSIGVEFQRDGTLYLDTGALNTAVSNGLQDKLAAGVTLGYESSTSNFTSFLTASLRTTGLISTHISDVEAQQTRIEDRISDWEDKLARIEQRYYRQYAALDALLFRLQTTSNALASAIDSLVNSQKN